MLGEEKKSKQENFKDLAKETFGRAQFLLRVTALDLLPV